MSKASYVEKLKDPRWQKKRLEVFNRDNYTCLDCGSSNKQLHVHHCFYERGEPWDTDTRFLLTLCSDCHEDRQSNESDLKRAIGFICAEMDFDNLKNLTREAVQLANNFLKAKECSGYERGDSIAEIMDGFELEYRTDIRWFNQAWNNKSFRKCYEGVTGYKPKWRKVA